VSSKPSQHFVPHFKTQSKAILESSREMSEIVSGVVVQEKEKKGATSFEILSSMAKSLDKISGIITKLGVIYTAVSFLDLTIVKDYLNLALVWCIWLVGAEYENYCVLCHQVLLSAGTIRMIMTVFFWMSMVSISYQVLRLLAALLGETGSFVFKCAGVAYIFSVVFLTATAHWLPSYQHEVINVEMLANITNESAHPIRGEAAMPKSRELDLEGSLKHMFIVRIVSEYDECVAHGIRIGDFLLTPKHVIENMLQHARENDGDVSFGLTNFDGTKRAIFGADWPIELLGDADAVLIEVPLGIWSEIGISKAKLFKTRANLAVFTMWHKSSRKVTLGRTIEERYGSYFTHDATTFAGCSGTPILTGTNLVVGMHLGFDKPTGKNIAISMSSIIDLTAYKEQGKVMINRNPVINFLCVPVETESQEFPTEKNSKRVQTLEEYEASCLAQQEAEAAVLETRKAEALAKFEAACLALADIDTTSKEFVEKIKTSRVYQNVHKNIVPENTKEKGFDIAPADPHADFEEAGKRAGAKRRVEKEGNHLEEQGRGDENEGTHQVRPDLVDELSPEEQFALDGKKAKAAAARAAREVAWTADQSLTFGDLMSDAKRSKELKQPWAGEGNRLLKGKSLSQPNKPSNKGLVVLVEGESEVESLKRNPISKKQIASSKAPGAANSGLAVSEVVTIVPTPEPLNVKSASLAVAPISSGNKMTTAQSAPSVDPANVDSRSRKRSIKAHFLDLGITLMRQSNGLLVPEVKKQVSELAMSGDLNAALLMMQETEKQLMVETKTLKEAQTKMQKSLDSALKQLTQRSPKTSSTSGKVRESTAPKTKGKKEAATTKEHAKSSPASLDGGSQ
jgi:hypothetical protein